MRRVPVVLPGAAYDVVVGPGALRELEPLLAGRRRVAVVTQSPVAAHHGDVACRASAGSELFLIPDGEPAKTLATAEQLCRRFASSGLLRDDIVVALGGGVVGDVAGFAAAVYHRGIDLVQVPTTVLAMVDSSIGGKTGVNLPEGKNLLGAFHQPVGVVADVCTLATLPEREYRAGLAEVAKYALMGDALLAARLRNRGQPLLERDVSALTDLVSRCAEIKAEIVTADPEERSGRRATLNYGHTLAHALETAGGHDLLHGEAVAIGLVFAAGLAEALGRVPAGAVDDHRSMVEALGLPVTLPRGADRAALIELMRRDKKAKGGLTFVLRGAAGLEPIDDPPAGALEHAFGCVGAGA